MPIDQHILLTVDAVIFGLTSEKRTHILLIERKNDPFKGQWAFPGGFVEDEEDLPVACARELEEETGLKINPHTLTQIAAFGKPGRDPRGRTVTVAFVSEIDKSSQTIQAADDAAKAQWWPLDNLPKLAFDHLQVLEEVFNKEKLSF